ncbi:Enhancer of polycomb-like transcription factor protein, putative isoform 1 [Hibiscus syriacus]|uniref:Enhancer of polycomb-like transcription factor protein, putative isoform 1 n=1 Tax=Hibiscus syriacus TaxID=106335 RepID=A0A6A3D105_HIBSY|nr:probable ADP-ribosylation factor GTPase-activating protein AGD14 [Hibiscus syriacus]KAE8735435.1 Enhancer of polycomb-like transcription factor protein, putative isoform 1 [Hibiscus syriacus]
MGSKKKVKDDERMERTIRGLLKLPENKRCINCNILGPQYVCTTFLTFVCTNCSGIHREFTHRVKSISLGKFSEEEVTALQAAGNERARQIYFKAWDPVVHSFPDGSNLHKLRDFIRQVYVERRYACESERGDSLPSLCRTNSSESRKGSVSSGRSRGPLYEDRREWSSNEGFSPPGRAAVRVFYKEGKSPRYPEEKSRFGSGRRNSMRIEIVDNRLRPEGTRSARQQDNPDFSHREPVRQTQPSSLELERSGSPVEQPVRDNLGETAPAIEVGEHSNENAGRDPDGSAENQKNASPGVVESLIDFSMNSELSNEVAAPNVQQVPPSNDGGSQSSDDFSSKGKAPPASNPNYLEALLFDLSDLSVVPVDNVSAALDTTSAPSTASGQNISLDGFSTATSAPQFLALTSTDDSSTVPQVVNIQKYPFNLGFQATTDVNGEHKVKASEGHSFSGMQQHQRSLSSASDNKFSAHPYTQAVEELNSQHGTSFVMYNSQQLTNVSTSQSSQAPSTSAIVTTYGVGVQPPAETKPNKRKELPQDLFTASYGLAPAAFPSWQNALPYGMGYGLQYYPNAMHVAAFPNTAKTNPFDTDTTPAQVPAFPSMASYLGALPSVQDPIALSHTSGFNTYSSGMAYHSSYTGSSPMTLGSPFISAMPSSTYMGDQSRILLQHSRLQGNSGFDGSNFISSTSSIDQRPTSVLSAPPNSFQTRNPFG